MKQDNRDNSRNWQTTTTGGTNYVGEIHFHGTQPHSQAKPNPKAVLLKAIKTQVETRLESSLHNRVYIIPSQDKNPNQVEHPWSIDVKSGSKPKVRLPQNTHIITVFDQEGVEGRLLILGQPGAGKTTMLLELAQKLVERAENDLNEPIPILLSLASWRNDHQSIKDWIVAELNSGKYYKVRPDITLQWLENGEIIPLLDGLDELAAERQEGCVQKLNEFLQPGNWSCPLVICSRIKEYQLYPTQLALNTSLELQPFTTEQIQDYLTRTGNNELGDSIRDDSALRELAQTPLLLNIIVLSCQKLSLAKWQELKSSKERLDYLFSTYVEVMLGRKYEGKRPTDEKSKRWLGWLSGTLIEQHETEFFIEKMQPTCLENRRQELIYRLSIRLIGGLIVGLIFGLSAGLGVGLNRGPSIGLFFGVIDGLSVWLMFGLMGELFFRLSEEIRTSEILQFNRLLQKLSFSLGSKKVLGSFLQMSNWKNVWWKGLMGGLRRGLIFGLMGGLIFGLIFELMGGSINGLIFGSSVCLIVGLVGGLMGGFESSEIKTRTSPNQGIWKSLQNAALVGVIVGVIVGLSIGRMGGLFFGLRVGLDVGVIVGLSVGLMGGLLNGGVACLQHFILRLILYCNGHIPWNYARFLDYATDRLFLQRVGGGYRFMHDLLRQHFAANYR